MSPTTATESGPGTIFATNVPHSKLSTLSIGIMLFNPCTYSNMTLLIYVDLHGTLARFINDFLVSGPSKHFSTDNA